MEPLRMVENTTYHGPPVFTQSRGSSSYESRDTLLGKHEHHGGMATRSGQKGARKRHQGLRLARFILRIVSIGLSLAVGVIIFNVLRQWGQTKDETGSFGADNFTMRLWPREINLIPNLLLGVAGLVAAALGVTALLWSFCTTACGCAKLNGFCHTIASLIGLAIWLAAVIYFKVWDTKDMTAYGQYDVHSWVCTHRDTEWKNVHFRSMCTELRFTFWAAVGVAAVELVSICLTIVIIARNRKLKKGSQYRQIDG